MLIFKYARDGTLEIEGLKKIAATCDVTTEGVGGAKTFFEAKAAEVIHTFSSIFKIYKSFNISKMLIIIIIIISFFTNK